MRNIAVILAAGNSSRCGFDKLFSDKFGLPVIFRTLEVFEQCDDVDEIVLVVNKEQGTRNKKQEEKFKKIKKIILGGKERFFSFKNAVEFLEESKKKNARILVHNGANPFITPKEISAGIKIAEKYKNVIFGFFTPNSIKQVKNNKVIDFLNRNEIFETQTPQISDLETFSKAIKAWDTSKIVPKDEAELLAKIGEEIHVFECSTRNQKITFPHDMMYSTHNLRIGLGEDSHRFTKNFTPEKPITLGGVTFPETQKTIEANSDGDVIFHALSNAILSSIGEKTLSEFANKMCQDGTKNSWAYVQKSLKIAQEHFPVFQIQNVVISLECKVPKINPRHEEIQKNIAKKLKLDVSQVGLTYTSGEKLSEFGRGKGIHCLVQILVR